MVVIMRPICSPSPKRYCEARYQWFMIVIVATWEAEIRRIIVQGQSG
jgi:hypothetical protein